MAYARLRQKPSFLRAVVPGVANQLGKAAVVDQRSGSSRQRIQIVLDCWRFDHQHYYRKGYFTYLQLISLHVTPSL
jgi:hypothetical protein